MEEEEMEAEEIKEEAEEEAGWREGRDRILDSSYPQMRSSLIYLIIINLSFKLFIELSSVKVNTTP